MSGKATERADLSSWGLTVSGRQLDSWLETDLGPLHLGNSCVAWSVCGGPSSGTRTCP